MCRLLHDAHAAELTARTSEAFVKTLGKDVPSPLGDLTEIRAALVLAEAVAALPVPAAVAQSLSHMVPRHLIEAVVPAAVTTVAAAERALRECRIWSERVTLDEPAFLGGPLVQAEPMAVCRRLQRSAAHPDALGEWTLYLIERDHAEIVDLRGMLALWDECAIADRPLSVVFNRVFYRALARVAFSRYPELGRFTGLGQDEARARFKSLDEEATELRRRALVSSLSRRPVPRGNGIGKRGDYTDLALIRLETGKQKRHIPLRQLFDRAGDAVQALKPCFMMSPLSVSQYLKPTGLRFDLLVIDEASQMRPEDALGAMARSGQIVVVGDPKQLPPTSFFTRMETELDDEDDDDEQVDAESILTSHRPCSARCAACAGTIDPGMEAWSRSPTESSTTTI